MALDTAGRLEIASRAAGTPANAIRLYERVADYHQLKGDSGPMHDAAVLAALEHQGVYRDGLTDQHVKVLNFLAGSRGKRCGLNALGAALGEDSGTLQDVIEPLLLRLGLVARLPSGRILTDAGANWLKETGK